MGWLDSTWCAVALYVAAAVVALALGARERARRRSDSSAPVWPTFWFLTAVLVLVMALGRALDSGQVLADLGREEAESQGWYGTRRSLQGPVVAAIATGWAVVVALAIWRVRERGRRYLPTALTIATLVVYVGIRLISLHQIDAVFNNRDVGGVRVGRIVELVLLGAVIAVSAYRFREPRSRRPSAAMGQSTP